MQAIDETVLAAARDMLRSGRRGWLCTIVRTYGSSPRPVGSIMVAADDGTVTGSLSGGCVEEHLLEKLAAGAFPDGPPQLLTYGLDAQDTEKLGLPCGGHLHVLLERLRPEHAEHFGTLAAAVAERRCVERTVRLEDGRMGTAAVDRPRPLALDDERLRQGFGPRWQLFLIGAGAVSRYLAEMAPALDFAVTVCDPRPEMLARWAVPDTRTLGAMPDDAIRAHARDPCTAIVALTHDPRIDDMGLMEALTGPAFYVGAMGSERTSASRRERLAALDLSPEQIARLRAPVGLPLGSRTPAEIAVAVLAELVQETSDLCRGGLVPDSPAWRGTSAPAPGTPGSAGTPAPAGATGGFAPDRSGTA